MARVELARDWPVTVERAMGPALDDATDELAADARARARAQAWGEGIGGHYALQIEGHVDAMPRGGLAGFIAAHKFTSGWLEHGTQRMPGRHVLEETARASGLPVRVTRGRRGRRRGARYR